MTRPRKRPTITTTLPPADIDLAETWGSELGVRKLSVVISAGIYALAQMSACERSDLLRVVNRRRLKNLDL